MFAEALRKNHVPFDLHIYQTGKTRFGTPTTTPRSHIRIRGRATVCSGSSSRVCAVIWQTNPTVAGVSVQELDSLTCPRHGGSGCQGSLIL